MSRHDGDRRWAPSPEQLAAYADGELDLAPGEPLRQRIEEWLVDNPAGAAEVQAQHHLSRLWRATAAEPSEGTWADLWTRINTPRPRVTRQTSTLRKKLGWSAALLLLAAAVTLAVTLTPARNEKPDALEDAEPFPVASAVDVEVLRVNGADTDTLAVGRLPIDGVLAAATSQEVEILRVNGADTDVLVVGELPAQGPMLLAKAGDVTQVSVDPAADNMKPEVRVKGPDAPMIWAPLAPEPVK